MITSRLLRITKPSMIMSQVTTVKYPRLPIAVLQKRYATDAYNYKDPDGWIGRRIGNREVVGFGVNGCPEYVDRQDFPFPSIRFKPPTAEFQALREKERGDWRLLTKEEKKTLYRSNFCQTFAEFKAPTGEWMYVVGFTLILTSFGIWLFIFTKLFVYNQYPLPKSYRAQWQQNQLCRILDMRNNPIIGIASKWDYENRKWKSKPWYIPWDNPYEGVFDDCGNLIVYDED